MVEPVLQMVESGFQLIGLASGLYPERIDRGAVRINLDPESARSPVACGGQVPGRRDVGGGLLHASLQRAEPGWTSKGRPQQGAHRPAGRAEPLMPGLGGPDGR